MNILEEAKNGFLIRYSGATHDNYAVALRLYLEWCGDNNIDPMKAKRPMIELYSRHMEDVRENMASTRAHHLVVVRLFYKYAEIDELIPKSPAAHIRIPRVYQDESSTLGLERNELRLLMDTAQKESTNDAAIIALLGYLGLRVSEACRVKIEDYQSEERGYRVLRVVGKGGKPSSIPLTTKVLRMLDANANGRTSGSLLLRWNGQPMNRKAVTIALKRLMSGTGIKKKITPHSLRHSYITACLDAGVPLRDVQIAARHSDPRVTVRYDRARQNHDRHANHTLSAFLS